MPDRSPRMVRNHLQRRATADDGDDDNPDNSHLVGGIDETDSRLTDRSCPSESIASCKDFHLTRLRTEQETMSTWDSSWNTPQRRRLGRASSRRLPEMDLKAARPRPS